jgi:hypothetical protein
VRLSAALRPRNSDRDAKGAKARPYEGSKGWPRRGGAPRFHRIQRAALGSVRKGKAAPGRRTPLEAAAASALLIPQARLTVDLGGPSLPRAKGGSEDAAGAMAFAVIIAGASAFFALFYPAL